jgi:hypothetical protein
MPRAPLPVPPELRPVRRAYALMASYSVSSCLLARKDVLMCRGCSRVGGGSSQFSIYDSSLSPAALVVRSLRPLTPHSRATRSRRPLAQAV